MANLARRLDALTKRLHAEQPVNCPYAWTSGFLAFKPENRQLVDEMVADYLSYPGPNHLPRGGEIHAGHYGLELFTKSGLDYDDHGCPILPEQPTPIQAKTIDLLCRFAAATLEYTLATGDHFPFIGWGLRLEERRSRRPPSEPCK